MVARNDVIKSYDRDSQPVATIIRVCCNRDSHSSEHRDVLDDCTVLLAPLRLATDMSRMSNTDDLTKGKVYFMFSSDYYVFQAKLGRVCSIYGAF